MNEAVRRATKWERLEAEDDLNEFGRRIRLAWLRTGLGLQEFSALAGMSPKALDSLLRRETAAGDRESKASVGSVVKIAKAGAVSLVWLAAGVGEMLDGAFADGNSSSMDQMSDELIRATHAAMAITGCTKTVAVDAARRAWSSPGGQARSVDEWLALVRALIGMSSDQSGERPSVRLLRISADG